ncbi:MAG: type II toxin-antitoxin system HicA family toxin [Candidatus Tectomicrobia bacterium]|nr:type II toxin-antitoxin system HicA family toxin [Candidatus Tectomicrobia bacterium]
MIPSHLLRQLRNTSVQELVRALERDGFEYRRRRGGGRVYRHPDGRRTVIHYHNRSDTLPLGTLRSVLSGAGWTEDDLRRLRLIS